MYVLKEGFDPTFLRNWFDKPTGNLYDGGFCREIDQALEKDCGNGPNDHSDLKALRAAARIEYVGKFAEGAAAAGSAPALAAPETSETASAAQK